MSWQILSLLCEHASFPLLPQIICYLHCENFLQIGFMVSGFVLCIYCLMEFCLYYLIFSPSSPSHQQELCSIFVLQHLALCGYLEKCMLKCINLIVFCLILSFLSYSCIFRKLCNIQRLCKPSLVQNSYTIKICFKEVYSKQHWLNDLTYFFLYLNSEVIPVFWVKSKVHNSPNYSQN